MRFSAATKGFKTFAGSDAASFAHYGLIELGSVAALETSALGMLTPVLPLYLTGEVGTSAEVMGLIFTIFYIALAMGEFGWGMLGDRIGIKRPLMLGTLLAALSTAGFVVTRNVNLLYVINFFRALGTSALFPTARGHIGATVPLRSRATFMAYYMTLQSLGRTVGTFLGGVVGDYNLRAVFFLAGGTLLAASIVAAFKFNSDVFKVNKLGGLSGEAAPDPPPRFTLNTVRNLSILGITIALFNLSFTVRNSFLPLHAASAGASVAQVGYLFTAWSIVTLLGTMPAGRLADRFGFQNAMIIGQTILAVTMGAFAYARNFLPILFIMVVNSLSNCIFRPAASARFSQLMSRARQKTAMGILGVFEDVGNVIGPGMAGFLWERPSGPLMTFMLSGACAFAGAVMGLFLKSGKRAQA